VLCLCIHAFQFPKQFARFDGINFGKIRVGSWRRTWSYGT